MSARPDRHEDPDRPVVPDGPSPVDLHTHTLRSDGTLEPADLVAQAAAAGVHLLAITDHDNLAAYRELTAPGAPALPDGLELLPGVEINCLTGGAPEVFEGELHILGFGIQPDDEAFETLLVTPAPGPPDPLRPDARRPAQPGHVRRRGRRAPRPGRHRVARPADRRPADDRKRLRDLGRGRLRALAEPGPPGVRAARGDRPGPGDQRDPRGRWPAGARPFRRGREPRIDDPRPAGASAWAGSRSSTGRSTRPTSTRSAGSPTSSASSRPAAATSTATPARMPRSTRRRGFPAVVGERLLNALARRSEPVVANGD